MLGSLRATVHRLVFHAENFGLDGFPRAGNNVSMSNILEVFRADVRSRRGRIREVASVTGIKLKTLQNYLYMPDRDPRSSNYQRLEAYYANRDREQAA